MRTEPPFSGAKYAVVNPLSAETLVTVSEWITVSVECCHARLGLGFDRMENLLSLSFISYV